eukprot:CAMPEP_0194027442 /NCGR_PEP_ID=MMETSP0009_2-20130614/1590_1 /TAXON_ID=210454 /ORGANISM="Grammatophora oceanica, Strain CCMP 410" /LENGTH=245 /DNA_ID=CAMNT_0038666505 /DNA_START=148 /DNA_END=885 /DNA_ORIENTATION=+
MSQTTTIGGQIFELCADGHRCENGAKCTENKFDEGSYYCDCGEIPGSGDSYAGLYCEHRATEYCTLRQEISRDFFCTNGGTCKATVTNSEAHLGCDCPTKYEGDHCQFTEGTAPTAWPYNGGKEPDSYGYPGEFGGSGGGGGGMHGGIIAVIVLVVVGVVCAAGLFVMRRRQKGGKGIDDAFAPPTSGSFPASSGSLATPDLALDADGGVLVEAIEGANGSQDAGSFEDVKINGSTEEEGSGEII